MNLIGVHKRVALSVGGVLRLWYMRTRTVGSELIRSSQATRLTKRGDWWYHMLWWEFGFHVEDNLYFAGRVFLAEKNVTWETNFIGFV